MRAEKSSHRIPERSSYIKKLEAATVRPCATTKQDDLCANRLALLK